MSAREVQLVELVDSHGRPIGSATVAAAHEHPGQLHRAFSVFLRDEAGRVLLQQRAAVKTRFPLRWANTCCGHPAPAEAVTDAAARRLLEELGIDGVRLTEIGRYSYFAEDPATGRVEHEYDHVLLGELPADRLPQPDPDEVAAYRWISVADLLDAVRANPPAYAPWLAGVTDRLADYLGGLPTSVPAQTRSDGSEALERPGGR